MAKKKKSEQRQRKLDRGQNTASNNKNNSAPRPGSVAANRAAGTNKAAVNQAAKASSPSPSLSPSPSPSPAPARQQAKAAAQMSVAERRAGAKAAGVTLKDFKQGNTGAKAVARKTAQVNRNMGGGNTAGSGTNNKGGGSAWDNLYANFDQGEWDAEVAANEKEYYKIAPNSGMKKGWQGAQLGENGFYMDSNKVNMIPQLGKYGFKAGDFAFDTDRYGIHDGNKDGRGGAGITGRIAFVKKNGEVRMERDGSSANPNWDKYAKSGSARMSSEGLYQDKYNVGYHGADDKGENYLSTSNLGDIGSYFKGYSAGNKSFGASYHDWAGGNRKDGYAGDVLKFIDQGHMKVSDDDYNMLVTDASNYDWDNRNEIAGRDAGSDSYDARTGGQAQNNITANENFYANRAAGYHQAGAMDPGEAAAKYGKNSQTQTSYEAPNNNSFDYEMPNLGQNMGPQYQSWQEQMGDASKPYASRSKSSGMNFNFNPYKFQQGQ